MEAVSYLNSLINYEKIPGYRYDLPAYEKFLARLGSPQKKLAQVILIAGTKGKGSTAAIINSCLIGAGYKTGLYTSPHLHRVNERIRINNKEISNKELDRYIKIIKPLIDHKTRIGARTFFEVLTTMAFMHFVRHNVDFAILEVGLGGRLDATNVVTGPVIPVITRIGYDHMNMLGKTLDKIANEKAGIIKKIPPPLIPPHLRGREGWGVIKRILDPAIITIHQRPAVEKVLKETAKRRRNGIIYADNQHTIKIRHMDLSGSDVFIDGALGRFNARLPLTGIHQLENLRLALAVLNRLKSEGYKIGRSAIEDGIRRTRLAGRFEVVSKKPIVIYDVAHNEDSFRALDENLKLLSGTGGRRRIELYFVFGSSADKDISYAVNRLFPRARQVVIVKADHPRAMEPMAVFDRSKKIIRNIAVAGSMRTALDYLGVTIRTARRPAIIVFGSFYLASALARGLRLNAYRRSF